MKVIILNIVAMVLFIINASTASAASLDDYAVISAKGDVKIKTAQVLKFLAGGKTCVMKGTAVKFKSNDLTTKQCRDADFRERHNIRKVRCRDIFENEVSDKCKGMEPLK